MGSGGSRRLCGEMRVGWWRKDRVGGWEDRSDVGGRSECSNGGWSRRRLGGRMDGRRGEMIRGDEPRECTRCKGGGKEEWEGTRTGSGAMSEKVGSLEQSSVVDGGQSGASILWRVDAYCNGAQVVGVRVV